MRMSPCCSPSTTASCPRGSMKRIDCGLTATWLPPVIEIVTGTKPPVIENFHCMSLVVSEWSLLTRGVHPLHMTNENMGFRMASGLLRSSDGTDEGGVHAGAVPHGTSGARAFLSTSFGLHVGTHRFVAGSAWM